MIATGNVELAVAVGVYVPDLTGDVGEVEVRVMVWEPAPTVTVILIVALL